jgi:phosphate transport system permease protein
MLSEKDKIFYFSLLPPALTTLGLLALIVSTIGAKAALVLPQALAILAANVWDPENERYGLLAPVLGTLVVASIAGAVSLVLGLPLTLAVAELLRGRLGSVLQTLLEMTSAFPTVVIGLWSARYLAPFLSENVMKPLYSSFGFIPTFSCRPLGGYSLLTAGLAIGFSVVPYTASIMIESYRLIPSTYREACYGIGATRYETARILVSLARPAIAGSVLLGVARAMGETTIAAMTVGNAMNISACLFEPSYTVPALIAAQFGNANLYRYAEPVLYLAALVFLALALVLSAVGFKLVSGWRVRIVG